MNTCILSPTPSLFDSIAFYEKLDFEVLSTNNPTIVSDGTVVIEINTDRYARAGVKLFSPDWKEMVLELEKITKVIKITDGFALADPSGCWIYLIESQSIIDMDLAQIKPSALGNSAGLSLETMDMELSFEIWQKLGFSTSMGSLGEGWISLKNTDNLTISLMRPLACPHLFFNPSLTYFNGEKNMEIIDHIRKIKIPITEEITYFNKENIADNIIIRDPGGLGFFLFND
ncbi:MAG: hypothetical protein HN600_17785 [Bacteroidetes bacterium]|jgi:hypothetical protein|nr:hypothetical protein [Bacteroidota bacterium]MBT4728724.1 hypothetical protein [Bacteroidota bacterium]MBT7828441.1 hypothetical protein [Bacteroidota bacterium]